MKKVLMLVCTLLFGIPAFAQSLTPAEREKGVQYLLSRPRPLRRGFVENIAAIW